MRLRRSRADKQKGLALKEQLRINQFCEKYKRFSDKSGLPVKTERLRTPGYKRLNVPKAEKIAENSFTNSQNRGIINIAIDEFTPCLRDTKTGKLVDTQVYKITDRKELAGYNEKTGWNVNWQKTPKDVDVYALTLKGDTEIQGLVGIRNDKDTNAAYVHWVSTAPRNNKLLNNGHQDYTGVGGHLFAIASEKSVDMGYGGFIHGFAANAEVEQHYIEKFGAFHVGSLHPHQFAIDEQAARQLLERYNYEWKK